MAHNDKRFCLENLSLSTVGHLVVAALMVTTIAVFWDDEKIISPDRVQIMEIDLNNVQITVDETKLYNTDVPMATVEKTAEPEPVPVPEPVVTEAETPKNSFVDETVTKQPEKPTTAPVVENRVETPAPAPKKKTLVRVNREVLSLDRTLTVSVVDALRVAMTRCWVIDSSRPDLNDIRAVAHLKMRPNGTVADVWFENAARAEAEPAFAYVLDTIRAAIHTCEPLSMLPRSEFSKWENIQLTFYPTSRRVM